MSFVDVLEAPGFGIDLVLKGSVILAASWLTQWAIKSQHPKWSVVLWRSSLVALLACPLMLLAPSIALPILVESAVISKDVDLVELEPGQVFADESRETMIPQAGLLMPVDPRRDDPAVVVPEATGREVPEVRGETSSRRFPVKILFGVWIGGVMIFGLRLILGHRLITAIHRASDEVPARWLIQLERIRVGLGVRQDVALKVSDEISSPILIGLKSASILVPRRLLEDEDSSSLMAATLAHELAHLSQNDLRWSQAWKWLRIFLWPHPLLWKAPDVHDRACELHADALAGGSLDEIDAYRSALAKIALSSLEPGVIRASLPMARSREIFGRLQRVTRNAARPSPSQTKRFCAALVMGLLVVFGARLRLVEAAEDSELHDFVVRCIDQTGEIVTGAEILAVYSLEEIEAPGNWISEVVSTHEVNGDGIAAFRLPKAKGQWMELKLYARQKGTLAGTRSFWSDEVPKVDHPIDLVMAPCRVMRGKVTVPTGFDVAKVRVDVTSIFGGNPISQDFFGLGDGQPPVSWRDHFSQAVGPDGRFEFVDLPDLKSVLLEVHGPSLGRIFDQVASLGGGVRQGTSSDPSLDVEVTMKAEAIIEGRLMSGANRRPVPNVTVMTLGGEAATDEEGQFRIDGLPERDGFLSIEPIDGWVLRDAKPVALKAGETVRAELVLERGAVVSGKVLDAESGLPVPRSYVHGLDVRGILTDTNGSYVIRVPEGESRIRADSTDSRYRDDGSDWPAEVIIDIAEGETVRKGVDIELKKAAKELLQEMRGLAIVRGRVVGSDGNGISGAIIALDSMPTARSGVDGKYEMRLYKRQKFNVSAFGIAGLREQSQEVDVIPGAAVEVADLVLEAAPGWLSGTVVDPTGRPVEGVEITADTGIDTEPSTVSGTDGAFRLEQLPEGDSIRIMSSKEGYLYRDWEGLRAGQNEVRLIVFPTSANVDKTERRHWWSKKGRYDPHPRSYVDSKSPSLEVERWVQNINPEVTRELPYGKRSVIAFCSSFEHRDHLKNLQRICIEVNAEAFVIFRSSYTQSKVKEFLKRERLSGLNVAIDRHLPANVHFYSGPQDATARAFETPSWQMNYFVVEADGIVGAFSYKIDKIEEYLQGVEAAKN